MWASDYDRAVSYVKRGAQFAYDPEELDYPVRWEAHMALFADVTDAAEDADAGDERWLDAALDLLDSADEVARVDLADVLRVTSKDWRLTHREDRRIAAATAAVPRADDPAPGLTPEQVLDLTLPLVRATVAYRRALSAS
ncbi:hypothetical protein [Microbacterium sp.]|uniref:hypothetical protein n=1 Tax=Microbacterium sp. TaxID=51671 RepID=UPI003C707051